MSLPDRHRGSQSRGARNFLPSIVNVLTLFALIVLAIGIMVAYRAGVTRGRRNAAPFPALNSLTRAPPAPPPSGIVGPCDPVEPDHATDERARLVRSYEAEATGLRNSLLALSEERHRVHAALAHACAETARYRQLVVDLENNAPPPLLDGPGSPDDLKLIVGVGPVLERMLQQLGVATYRQIARWSARDIDEFDAKLPEFPGRIRRDGWVAQARALHQSKYGEVLPARDRS